MRHRRDDAVVTRRYRNCTKISIPLRTFLKRCKSACDRANVPPARICISDPRTGQVDIRDQQSAHSRVHSMSYRWRSARGGCDTGVRRAGLMVSSYVFRRVSNIQEAGRRKGSCEIKVVAIYWCATRLHSLHRCHPFVSRIILARPPQTIAAFKPTTYLQPPVCTAHAICRTDYIGWIFSNKSFL